MLELTIKAGSAADLMQKLAELLNIGTSTPNEVEAKPEPIKPVISQAEIEKNIAEAPVHELPPQPPIEEVRAALKELRDRKGADAVRELLKAYRADNLMELKPEDYLGALARAKTEVA